MVERKFQRLIQEEELQGDPEPFTNGANTRLMRFKSRLVLRTSQSGIQEKVASRFQVTKLRRCLEREIHLRWIKQLKNQDLMSTRREKCETLLQGVDRCQQITDQHD